MISLPLEIFSYTFFIFVPLLNVLYDDYVDRFLFYSAPVEAMTFLNILNAVGLLLAALAAFLIKPLRQRSARHEPSLRHMQLLLFVALIASLSAGIYNNFISLNLRETSDTVIDSSIAFYVLIESAPMLLAWLIVVSVWKKGRMPSNLHSILLMALFLIVAISMNFSRGSRVTVFLLVLIGFQLFYLHVYRLSKLNLIVLAIGGAIAFNVMTVYKHLGIQGVSSYLAGEGVATYVNERYTSPVRMVIGDIGRADIQAPILESQMMGHGQLAYGRTYAKALTLLLPDFLDPLPNDWSKVIVGGQFQLEINPGSSVFEKVASGVGSSRIYGMVGESLINFGVVGALLSFFIFGLLSRWLILYANTPAGWEKALIAPIISVFPIFILFYDLDNIIFRLIMLLTLPGALLLLNRLVQRQAA